MTHFSNSIFSSALAVLTLATVGVTPALAQSSGDDGPQAFDAVPADAASPFGGLSVAPTRVELGIKPDGTRARTGKLTLYNSSTKPTTFRLEPIDLIPLEEGGYDQPEDGADRPNWSAAPLIRFAPRQVTLQPGMRQTVKVLSRARRDTPKGEYRTHLRVSTIPLVEAVRDDETEDSTPDGAMNLSVGLEYRITLPVLLRVGDVGFDVEMTNAAQTHGGVNVWLVREGDASQPLDILAYDARGEQVGQVKGVSVYPPLTRRQVKIPLEAGQAARRVVVMQDADDPSATPLSEIVLSN